ncbi:MAG: hypothetical protein M1485_00425 [Chloroflexi bacterium]|nr:hypothetical protein [Chloroflexota bacterium]
MKSPLPLPHSLRSEDHLSYQSHRKQVWQQILLPILLTVLIFIAVIVLTSVATFRDNGEVGRWAAMSTIWLLLPVLIGGFMFLIILVALIYLMLRLTNLIPPYSYQAQRIFYRIEGGAKNISRVAHKPVLLLQELGTVIKAAIAKALERK